MRMLAADFEIGHMLRDSIVPKAVLYYTGEAGDEEDGDVRKKKIIFDKTSKYFIFLIILVR